MSARLFIVTAFPWLLLSQPGGSSAAADLALQLQTAYREQADPKTRPNACKTFLAIGTSKEATAELRANALLHYGDLFGECRAPAPGAYNSSLDVYQDVIGIGTDAQKALAANNLAAACYATDRERAIRAMSQIPFDNLRAPSRAEYRINLAHLYVLDQRWGPAMETYRLALADGADSRGTGMEMEGLVAPLAGYKGWEHSWAETVADAARVLCEKGAPTEGAKVIRAAFNQRPAEPQATALVKALLFAYSTLPIDLERFLTSESEWLSNSAYPGLNQIAAAAQDTMNVWLVESGIPASRYSLLMPPERKRPGAADAVGRPMRAAFSQFLSRLGDAWAAAENRPDHSLQAEARYTLAWVIWRKNIAAAVRSATLTNPVSTTRPEVMSKVLRELRQSYRPNSMQAAYLTGTELSTLFELYGVLAEAPEVEQSLLEEAVEIRSRLYSRGLEVAPVPKLLRALAAKNEERHRSVAARLYLDAKHDFERAGLPLEALVDLRNALRLSPTIDLSHLALSVGQRDLVGLAGAGAGDWSVRAEVQTPAASLPPVEGAVETASDGRTFYRIVAPGPLTGGSQVTVRIHRNETLVRNLSGEVRASNADVTGFQPPSEGDMAVEGRARPGVSMVTVEVRLPPGACPAAPAGKPAAQPRLGGDGLIQAARGPVDPESGAFTLRLDRAVRAGEIVTLREIVEEQPGVSTAAAIPPQEVGSGPLNWGPLRAYASVGAQIFNPSGPVKPFATPVVSATADWTLFSRSLRMDHPLCFTRGETSHGVPVNLFAEARLEPPTVTRSPAAGLRQALPGRAFEAGIYVPYSPRVLRYQFHGAHYALFGAPLLRFGKQYGSQLDGSGNYWAAGLRFGAWKLIRTDGKAAPILLTHYEISVGRWNSFIRTDQGPRRAPLRYEFAWSGKVHNLAPSFGVRLNMAPGPNEYRFDIGVRYELADLLHRVRRGGLSALSH